MADQETPPDVEITESIPSGLKVTNDTTYRMLVVGSFSGSTDSGSLSGPMAEGPVEINAESFNEVMAGAAPSVQYATTDPLLPGNVMVQVNLRFDSMRAFDPVNLVQQIPSTKSLFDIREEIVERLRGKLSSDKLASIVADAVSSNTALAWLADAVAWTPSTAAADGGQVDSLMGQLDLGDSSGDDDAPPPKSPIGNIVSAAAQDGSSIPQEEASALRRSVAEIDRRIGTWVTAILHAPEVKSIESAWRSLGFLVSQTNFRKGLRMSLLHAPPGQLLEVFRTKLIDPVFDEGADSPDLIVINEQYSNSASDIEALDELAQHAASLPAVVMAGVSHTFFGVKHAWQLPTLPTISNIFDQWQFAKWKSLREQPYARSLGVVFGRCLIRAPHERGDVGDLDFGYREEAIGENDFLWACGAIAAAAAVAHSFADTGWPTAMAGFVHGRVEGFATAKGGKKGDKTFGPTDTTMAQPKIEELATVGVCAAVGIKDHEDAIIWNGLSAARPHRLDPDALLEVSLPYQLFAARLSSLLFELKSHLSSTSAEQIQATVTEHVKHWLGLTGEIPTDQLSVQTRPAEDAPNELELAVTVTPPPSVLPGGIPLVMGYRIK